MKVSHQLYSIPDLSQQSYKVSSILLLAALHCALLNLKQVCANSFCCRAILTALSITICDEISIYVVWSTDRERLHNRIPNNILLVEERLVRYLGVASFRRSVRKINTWFLVNWLAIAKASPDYLLIIFIWRMKLKLVGHWCKAIDHT